MHRTLATLGALLAAATALAFGGCASEAPTTTTEPTARQRANAEKQQQLQEMLEKGQRN
jgi:hypothetical protein